MKKTLIALALTALPVASMAEVVLYGQIKGGYEVQSSKTDGVKQANGKERTPYTNGIVDYGSRIGFKGHEHLNGNLQAIWQLEQKVDIAGNAGNGFGTRESFIGLQGDFGKVRVGHISNYFDSDMDGIDAWEASSKVLKLGNFTRTEAYRTSIRYDSPEFYGFTAALQFSPRDNVSRDKNEATNSRDTVDDAIYGAGLTYKNKDYGFFGQYGFEFMKNGSTAGKYGTNHDGYVHRVQAGYDANNIYAAVGYQYIRNLTKDATLASADTLGSTKFLDPNSTERGTDRLARQDEIAVTAGYHFGNTFAKVSYAHGFDVKNSQKVKVKNSGYDQVILGVDYSLSKRTTLNAQAGWMREGTAHNKDNDKKAYRKTTAFGVGLKHVF